MAEIPEDIMDAADNVGRRISYVMPDPSADRLSIAEAIFDERLRHSPPPVQQLMVVNPIEWELEDGRDAEFPRWRADVLGKPYTVFKAWWGARDKWGYVFDGFHDTPERAKAAAQADLEERVRSVLSAQPAPAEHLVGDGEASIIACLAEGKPFVFDPATNFLHADDGTVEGGIRYLPAGKIAVSSIEDEMMSLAARAVTDSQTRSSFSQLAEWAHDKISDVGDANA